MSRARLILLPGLHGTGELFGPLLPFIWPELRPKIVSYPTHGLLGYHELLNLIEDDLAHEPELILLAESFSGPLAIRYAARHPQQVRAVVLCATFIKSPVWPISLSVFNCFMWTPPPMRVLRWLLLGRAAPRPLCRWVQKAIARVDPAVIAHRLRQVRRLDASDDLASCRAPVLYLSATSDAIVHTSALRRMLEVKPDIVVRAVPGPHMLLQLRPTEAWAQVGHFLKLIPLQN